MRVFVMGGTGQIGQRLITRLLERGDQPVVLTRRTNAVQQNWRERCREIVGDPTQPGEWMQAIRDCDAVVNLAGANLFGRRWNAAYKELLRASRIQATSNVAAGLAANPLRQDGTPKAFVSGSAIGWYGVHGDEELDESAEPGSDFLATLCRDWESATRPAVDAGVRTVQLRTGVVLDPVGGALKQILTPFKLFMGGPAGSGKQYMSWIHHADEVGIILHALDHPQAQGPMNTTAPNPVTNRDFGKALGRVLGRPSFMPTPAFALRVVVGEAAYVITTGQRVVPRRAMSLGYVHKFPEIEGALRDLLGRPLPESSQVST